METVMIYNKNRHEEARKRMTGHHERGKRENTMTDKTNERPIAEKPAVRIEIHAAPKGEWKALGGSDRDQWNERLSDLVIGALPVNQRKSGFTWRLGCCCWHCRHEACRSH